MSRTIRALLALALLVCLPGNGASAGPQRNAGSAAPTSVSLTILHTNDTHSHLLPFSYPSIGPIEAGPSKVDLKERSDIGGIARRATLVNTIRREQAARNATVWVVDAGDFYEGTPLSTVYRGEADIAAMNAVGYTMATLGNHEFNLPLAQVKKLISLAKFPFVVSNVNETATGKPLAREFLIEKVGPVRIGVFGLVTHESARYPAAKDGAAVADEIEAARRMVTTLRPQVDIIMAISHAGEQVDDQIAAQLPGVDVIIGGHSHSRFPAGDFVRHSDDLKANDVNGTIIVQAHQYGGELGRLDLMFVRDAKGAWHLDQYRARLIPIDAAIPADPAVEAVVDRFWKPIAAAYGETLGEASGDFVASGDDEAPYNLFADAVRETYGTDVDLENTSGVRAPLPKGRITRGDLVMMDPFNNTVVTLKLSGRDLKQVLAQYRPFVSGIRYRLQNKELVEATVNGQPIEDTRMYSVSTNSYFASNYLKGFQTTDVVDTKRRRLDVVTDYIRKKGTVTPVYDGRRVAPSSRAR